MIHEMGGKFLSHQVDRGIFDGKNTMIKSIFFYLQQEPCDNVTVLSNCLRLRNINCHKLSVSVQCQCDSSDKGGQNE